MKKRIFFVSILVIISICFIGMLILGFNGEGSILLEKSGIVELDWYTEVNGNQEKVDFPSNYQLDIYEEHTIYTILPDDSTQLETLFYRSMYQKVIVKIDDEIIYTYDTDETRLFGKANPKKLNIINLPTNISGKTLSITIQSPYFKYSGYYSDLYIGLSTSVIQKVMDDYLFGFISGLVLFFVVIVLSVACLLFFRYDVKTYKMQYIFLSGLFVSLWVLGDSKLITLYINGFTVHQLTYVSLMFFIIAFALYLLKISGNKFKKVFNLLLVLSIINILAQFILYVTNISDYVVFYPLSLLLILVLFSMYAINNIYVMKQLKKDNKLNHQVILETVFVIAFVLITVANIILRNMTNKNINNIIGLLFIGLMVAVYSRAHMKMLNSAVETKMYKERFKEAQNYLIQSQMKPHFIFNTLGAIRTLIISEPKTAYNMITSFSKYLRANINNIGPGEKVTFAHELDYIKAYADIELIRFKGRLNIEYDIQCTEFSIPPLSIEPLVENAVKHGVCKKVKGGTVKISSREYEDKYVVTVSDNGVGFDVNILDTEKKANSVGLKYIMIRLKELSDADFNIESAKGKGTVATVTFWKNINN